MFERETIEGSIILIKHFFDVSQKVQEEHFRARASAPRPRAVSPGLKDRLWRSRQTRICSRMAAGTAARKGEMGTSSRGSRVSAGLARLGVPALAGTRSVAADLAPTNQATPSIQSANASVNRSTRYSPSRITTCAIMSFRFAKPSP